MYPNHIARVPRGALLGQFIDALGATIRQLAAATPPKRVPSFQECRFCDISAADCPERMDDELAFDGANTDDF